MEPHLLFHRGLIARGSIDAFSPGWIRHLQKTGCEVPTANAGTVKHKAGGLSFGSSTLCPYSQRITERAAKPGKHICRRVVGMAIGADSSLLISYDGEKITWPVCYKYDPACCGSLTNNGRGCAGPAIWCQRAPG